MTRRNCATENCVRIAGTSPDGTLFRWCDDCTAVVLRTGRPPVLPIKFVPVWLRNLAAKDMTRAA